MTLRELFVKLGVKADDKQIKEFDKSVEAVKDSMFRASAMATAFAGSLFALVKTAANAGDEVLKTSQKYGVSAQTLQELQYAARGEAEQLTQSFRFLNKSIAEAGDGGEQQIETFSKLGVQLKNTDGSLRSSEDILLQLSDRFKEMPDGANKTSAAMKVLGKSGADLIPFLNQGSEEIARLRQEALETGFVMDGDALKASELFEDSFDDLKNTLIGLRNILAVNLMPVITDLMKVFKLYLIQNRELIKLNLSKAISVMIGYLRTFWGLIKSLYTSMTGIVQIFGGWERAIKGVLAVMLALFGLQILSAIGNTWKLIASGISAFRALGAAAMWANIKALAIPILIGAAIVAIGLIIEDLIAFFQGRDSVTGIIVEEFTKVFSWLEEKFQSLSPWIQTLVHVLLTPFRAVISGIQAVGQAFSALKSGDMEGVFGAIGGFFKNTYGAGDGTLKGSLGFSPSQNPVSKTQSSSVQQSVQAPITVNVPAGTPPDAVAGAAQAGVYEALEGLFRQTEGQVASPIME